MYYNQIIKHLHKENIIGKGKEITAYKVKNQVIKEFHKNRLSPLKLINQEGLKKLTTLDLKCFNNPKELIYDKDIIVGYTEDYIKDDYLNIEFLKDNLDLLYEDIITLSNNGFIINDIQYNYLSNDNTFKFIDMTSYEYIDIDKIKSNTGKKFILDKINKDNIRTINTFLIGFFEYNAYRKGEHFELTKTNKAVMFNNKYCHDKFYGEHLKQKKKTRKLIS
ncbi:MAG: hypothetical protein IKF19_02830 [Bacilli bacterium]|nr:hypothetical protein [Bacilli bacterium]